MGPIFLKQSEILAFMPLAAWPYQPWNTRRQIASTILDRRGDWRASLLAVGNPNATDIIIIAG